VNDRTVLIDTYVDDIHAIAVKWALQRAGANCFLLYGDDFPTHQQITLRPSERMEVAFTARDQQFTVTSKQSLAYWCRRRSGPVISEEVHPADQRVALREANAMLSSVRVLLSAFPDCFTINPLVGRNRGTSKAFQLWAAAQSGLNIPPTVMSNSHAEVDNFLRSSSERKLYKPFNPAYWLDEEFSRGFCTFATSITADSLPPPEALIHSPGIYQPYVDKSYEVRVVVMGASFFATRLDSQQSPESSEDWRTLAGRIPQSTIEVPPDVRLACLRFMERCDLLFGCFDFIVGHDARWIFLECNEQGQWLWQEDACPHLKLLDAFTQFILSGDRTFDYKPSATPPTFGEFVFSDDYQNRQVEWEQHTRTPVPFRSIEPKSDRHPPTFNGMAS